MEVTIGRNGDRVEVVFHNWKEERGRYARIELDIIRALTHLCSGPREEDRVIYQEPNFSADGIKTIVKILQGYLLEPTINL